MSRGTNEAADKICRERPIRSGGGGTSVITIPPIIFEFTEFGEEDEIELEADIGGDEIVLRRPDTDEQNEN
ncbi:hypothetical protein [Natrinema sp. DC36]|uniref:hypothetical protein n=1 Tax=Natrinema sp. DC36 TaxID=2878680 RepID=UPI001CF0A08F|nr:hypothetical protein [Natrinema sp. DC36]